MLSLRIRPGCLWAAYSSDPSKYSQTLSQPDLAQPPSTLLSDAMKRGPRAHLFQLYPLLCQIVSIGHEGPVAWMPVPVSESTAGLPTPAPSPVHKRQTSDGKSVTGAGQSQPKEELGENGEGVGEGQVIVRLDAKELARKCLEELGKEMGLVHG